MEEKPLVSVVIPTYKRSDTLLRAVESVLSQTYDRLEVIVVDDNEPDDEFSLALQQKLKEITDPRVRYVQQKKHINGCAARNAGIDASNGELVGFLDDDDVWYSDKLEKQLKLFSPKTGLVYTGANAIYVNDGVTYSIRPKAQGDLSKRILLENCIGSTSTVVAKKDILEKAGKFDVEMPARQDYDLWTRVCQITEVSFVPEAEIDYYNFRDGEQISSSTEKYEKANQRVNEKYRDLIQQLTPQEKDQRERYELYHLANKALRNNDRKKARFYLKKLMKKGFNRNALILLLLSPFDYGLILKLRKLI